MWLDKQGVHAIIPGEKPDAATLERMTLDYQNRIRQSPMFDEMVNVYGLARAEDSGHLHVDIPEAELIANFDATARGERTAN